MHRIKTVADLKELLEELPDEMPIMAQHQPNWPLRECIGGIWIDDGHSQDDSDNECEQCEHVTLGEPKQAVKLYEHSELVWARECFHCGHLQECAPPMPEEEKVAYIILNGQPYDGTPYGSKRAWEEVGW